MATTLPAHSHLLPLSTPNPSRRGHLRLLPTSAAAAAASPLQNPSTHYPILPPPAPAPSTSLLAAEEASLAPRRTHRLPGSVASPRPDPAAEPGLVAADDAVLRRALEVRRSVAAEALVAVLHGGKVGGLTYVKNLTAQMGAFVDRVVVGAAAMQFMAS